MASVIELAQPILGDGIRSTYFFNGRLLTGSDMRREQEANREADRRLGQAAGEGVAFGLEVFRSPTATRTAPVVTVRAGLAINRRGQTLSLPADADVTLVRRLDAGAPAPQTFDTCRPLQAGTYIAGDGVYVLTVAPAQGTEGRAPTSGLGNAVASCNTDAVVEGVQFRLVQINPPFITEAELQQTARLRNLVAHKCFGTAELAEMAADPFGPRPGTYGLLDELRAAPLTDCDVPLAVLYWTLADGLKFVDAWAVRRRLTSRQRSDRWSPFLDDRRASEAEAAFLQFEEQIEDIRATETNLASLALASRFKYLPPVGLLPVSGLGSATSFSVLAPFGQRTSRDIAMLDAERLRQLLDDSLSHEPFDLDATERVQLYFVWENYKAVHAGTSRQLTLVFAGPAVSYRGTARFGHARWNLSRFAPTII